MEPIELGHYPKTIELEDGTRLYFWYSKRNCTIIRSSSPRADVSAKQENVIARIQTSHWLGNVNFSKRVKELLMLI